MRPVSGIRRRALDEVSSYDVMPAGVSASPMCIIPPPTQLRPDRRRQRGKSIVDDQHLGARIVDGVDVLGSRPTDIERHDDRARPWTAAYVSM